MKETLADSKIKEYNACTKEVSPELKKYVETQIFPQYAKNDQGHGILHILEVVRRSFVLNKSLNLGLDPNMIYAIAASHDLGKYEEHETSEKHAKIAGRRFIQNQEFSKFFTDSQRQTIKEAIEDHSSSLEDMPRSDYGKLVSSADRNTSIEMVFIRSFFVGKRKNPEQNMEEYLEFTLNRLRKRYSTEDPENMFFADDTYKIFLEDMRELLKDGEKFKKSYCEINHVSSREHSLKEEPGEISYINLFVSKKEEPDEC